MAVSPELIDFVKEGLQRGIPKAQLDDALRRAGWDREQVASGLRQFADLEFAIPVPRPTPYLNAREAFMYVVMFSTLYLSAYYLGSLVFELINLQFPDPTANDYAELAAEATLRWSVSTVVVAFPVFLYVAWLLGRELRADVTKRASKIRRQLTYLTLLVAAAFLIGDVTTLIYNFLGGDMTVRFVLKVVTVAIIAGAGFWYYLRQLRQDERALEA